MPETQFANAASAQPLVLATRSAGKLRELKRLCESVNIATVTLDECGIPEQADEESIEAFETFDENAAAKARHFARLLPGRVILAEDSGLEVEALGLRPGVHSKRWSGSRREGVERDADNNAALERALRDADDRRARYRCVAVLVYGAQLWRAEGSVEGQILRAPRGSNGFGYDPWFASDELGKTFAEASADEKASVSHRARAVRVLLASALGDLRRVLTSVL